MWLAMPLKYSINIVIVLDFKYLDIIIINIWKSTSGKSTTNNSQISHTQKYINKIRKIEIKVEIQLQIQNYK